MFKTSYHILSKIFQQSFNQKNKRFFSSNLFNNFGNKSYFTRTSLALLSYNLCSFVPVLCDQPQKKQKQYNITQIQTIQKKQQQKTILAQIWYFITHLLRYIQLCIIFTPPVLLLPLLCFKSTQNFWMDCFVKSVERAGVVFIKAFQYMSHRRDIIGPQLAFKFQYLRQKAPTHSYETTKRQFIQQYGKNLEQIFQQFDPLPIASGSVSQVYRAKYKGKKVAVKVRHPNVQTNIIRDINIMFFFSRLAAFFKPALAIPITQVSLKKTLTDQIDFTFQMKNLNRFNEMFKNHKQIFFPLPFQQSTKDSVLVQTYVQGIPVTYYESNFHPLNKIIARLGSTAFFQMLMKNNFIHADCHGGNILVQIRQQSYNMFTQLRDYLKEVAYKIETQIKSLTFQTQKMKKLYLDSRMDQFQIIKMCRKFKQKVVVNVIDVGMVIQLNQVDKKNFVNFIKSIIEGRSEKCAQMIYKLSNFEGQKIIKGKFSQYYNQLLKCFSVIDGQELDDLQGIDLFKDMLSIIREHHMKLDGQFATLLTNMMVLEAMAKHIDPQIKILKIAFPYFKYVQDFGRYSS